MDSHSTSLQVQTTAATNKDLAGHLVNPVVPLTPTNANQIMNTLLRTGHSLYTLHFKGVTKHV